MRLELAAGGRWDGIEGTHRDGDEGPVLAADYIRAASVLREHVENKERTDIDATREESTRSLVRLSEGLENGDGRLA